MRFAGVVRSVLQLWGGISASARSSTALSFYLFQPTLLEHKRDVRVRKARKITVCGEDEIVVGYRMAELDLVDLAFHLQTLQEVELRFMTLVLEIRNPALLALLWKVMIQREMGRSERKANLVLPL